jgi:hypothetical protein
MSNRSAGTFSTAIVGNFEERSLVRPDSWRGWKTKDLDNAGVKHFKVSHTFYLADPDPAFRPEIWNKCLLSGKSRITQASRVTIWNLAWLGLRGGVN